MQTASNLSAKHKRDQTQLQIEGRVYGGKEWYGRKRNPEKVAQDMQPNERPCEKKSMVVVPLFLEKDR